MLTHCIEGPILADIKKNSVTTSSVIGGSIRTRLVLANCSVSAPIQIPVSVYSSSICNLFKSVLQHYWEFIKGCNHLRCNAATASQKAPFRNVFNLLLLLFSLSLLIRSGHELSLICAVISSFQSKYSHSSFNNRVQFQRLGDQMNFLLNEEPQYL